MPRRVIRRDGPAGRAVRRLAAGAAAVRGPAAGRRPCRRGHRRSSTTATSSLSCSACRGVRLPARGGHRRAFAAQRGAGFAHLRSGHVLRAVLDRAERAAQGVRLSRHRLSRGRRRAPHRGARAGARRRGRRHAPPDMEFTLDSVACMGACSQAPVMRVGDDTYGNLTPDQTRKIVRGVARDEAARLGAPVARMRSGRTERLTRPARARRVREAGAAARRSAPSAPGERARRRATVARGDRASVCAGTGASSPAP